MSYVGKLKIGTQVLVSSKDKFVDKKAIVKFVGKLAGKPEEFIGVELETPDGNHSGSFQGKEYFKAKQNHGMFAKPKVVKLSDGSPVTSLLMGKSIPGSKPSTTATTATSKVTRPPVGGVKKTENKLSNQLKEAQNNHELEALKEELQEANKKIQVLESGDSQQEIAAMRTKLRELEDENRMLKVNEEKVKLQVDENQESKTKELQEKIDFFNSQKEFHEKEKADLKKKIQSLEADIEENEGIVEEFENLTMKNQQLEGKNAKLKEELEAAKTEVKNIQMLGGGGAEKQGGDQNAQIEELKENIKILNETVSLLEGDLNEQKEKSALLQTEMETLKAKSSDTTKLEKKLKARDEQLEALQAELQVSADAAAFAEKLTLKMLKKDEQLSEATTKLKEYLSKVEQLEIECSESKEMVELQTLELETQEEQIQKHLQTQQQQINHIAQLNKQIGRYKNKIAQLSQNNETLSQTNSMMIGESEGDESMLKTYINTDMYQHKYYEAMKAVQLLSERFLDSQLQQCEVKNIVGVRMLNLIETVPDSYTSQFYPEVIQTIVMLKSANDKLYLLFDTAARYLLNKSETIYSKDNQELQGWILMILDQVPYLYGQLAKVEMSLTTAETEDEMSDILSNTVLKELIRRIDGFASDMLHRFASENIDASLDLDVLIETSDSLDKICGQGRRLEYEFETRIKLSSQTMMGIHKIFEMIALFKESSEVGENAQVDTMIENFLKSLLSYLQECCTNPHLRIKTQTKQYLQGLQLIIRIFGEIEINETINELSSLYSETEDIKMLKETLLTTQFHLKELINDLGDIVYSNSLSKIKCSLPGKIWVEKSKQIHSELSRFQQITEEKEEMRLGLNESKKKIMQLQKEIKERQSTKELYEKRIGELQLKVEQASSLESENKRQADKIRSFEDTNKLIEEELQQQVNKRKDVEEELKKMREKFEKDRHDGAVGGRRSKTGGLPGVGSIAAGQDVTSSALYRNVLSECHTLRMVDTKKKILQLKQSPLMAQFNRRDNPEKVIDDGASKDPSQMSEVGNLRRSALSAICDLKITGIDALKKGKISDEIVTLESLELQAQKISAANASFKKEKVESLKIGSLLLKNLNNEDKGSSGVKTINIDANRSYIASY